MTATGTLRIGTRESRLALAQTAIVADVLGSADALGPIEVVPISTQGDAISAQQPRGRWVVTDGQFTRELERALLGRRVDLVVHSFKDLPTAPVEGLTIAAVLERADARDCLLTVDGGGLDDLPFGGRIGTSSPRRAAQLAAVRSDLIAMPLRGNVETRLRRLAAGEYDGLILAAAGLDRLGIEFPDAARLPYDLMLPAPAQGALAVQVRSDDASLREAVERIDHAPTRIAVEAERALLRRIGGGCLAPLGAFGEVSEGRLRLRATLENERGEFLRAEGSGSASDVDVAVGAVAGALAEAAAVS